MSPRFGDAVGVGLVIFGLVFAATMCFNVVLWIERGTRIMPLTLAVASFLFGVLAMVWQYFYGLAW